LYCAIILAVFKPWRTLIDLKHDDESFPQAFHNFLATTSTPVKRVIENIHYFYECSDKARERRTASESHLDTEWTHIDSEQLDDTDLDEADVFGDDAPPTCQTITENDIEHAADGIFSSREELYAEVAMNIAEDYDIFAKPHLTTNHDTPPNPILASATTHDQLQKCNLWSDFLADDENTKDNEDPDNSVDQGRVILHPFTEDVDVDVGYTETVSNHALKYQPPTTLNDEQRIAYNIVINHLQTALENKAHEPLLMILEGEAGTGKSQLLSIITQTFEHLGAAHLLARTATSGVAACLIGGSTLHSWAGLPPWGMPRSDKWATHPNPDMAR